MLSSLEVEDFRCIERARLSFDARATGIVGPNASGKTSLLEAIYFLGHGRSFRVAQRDKLIRHGAAFLRVVGRLDPGSASQLALQIPPHSSEADGALQGTGAPGQSGANLRTALLPGLSGHPSDWVATKPVPGPVPGHPPNRVGAGWAPQADRGDSGRSDEGARPGSGEVVGVQDSLSIRDSVGVQDSARAGEVLGVQDSGQDSGWPGDCDGAVRPVTAGVQYQPDRLEVRLAGRPVSGFSEIAALLPIQVIDPGVHRLIEEGSARRRRLLDWGVFHVKHDFLAAWRRYQRALGQRNAALRSGAASSLVTVWDVELSACAQLLDAYRLEYLDIFREVFRRWAGRLVGPDADLEYRRGWRAGITLEEALAESRSRDQRIRTTSVGPHRADLQFTLAGGSARDRISRGQQKMLASAFVLAQVALRATLDARPTCLLLDDPAAELDVDNLGKLLGALAEIPAQLIVTAVSEAGLRGLPVGRTFHVEQGKVR